MVLLVSLAGTAGCSGDKSVSFKSAGMTHTIAEGSSSVPEDLKKFMYPKATIAGSTSASDKDGEHARFLSLSSTDDLEKVAAWYTKALESGGWNIDSNEHLPRLVNISGHRETTEINILMAEDGQKTTVTVSRGRALEEPIDEAELEHFTPDTLTPPME